MITGGFSTNGQMVVNSYPISSNSWNLYCKDACGEENYVPVAVYAIGISIQK